MAAQLPSALQRTARTVPSTFLRSSTRQARPTFQHRGLAAATRAALTSPQSRASIVAVKSKSYNQQLWRNTGLRRQTRWSSNESGPALRSWGFEDINSSLPSATPSPSHSPMILIDVREPAELTATGIIPSALNIPLASQPDALYLTGDEFETRFGFPKPQTSDKSQLVFYCKAGVRARAAAQLAVQAGYDPEKIGIYEGSWLDWEKKGGKVEKWEGGDD